MANAKKQDTKKTKSEGKVEARPIGQGKDPLSEGARLHNETNTTAETHYKADNSELKAEEKASKIRGQNADERAEEHNAEAAEPNRTSNPDQTEQDEVAEDRVEPGTEKPKK